MEDTKTVVSRVLIEVYSDGDTSFKKLPLEVQSNRAEATNNTEHREEERKTTNSIELDKLPEDLRCVIFASWVACLVAGDTLDAKSYTNLLGEKYKYVAKQLGLSNSDVETALTDFSAWRMYEYFESMLTTLFQGEGIAEIDLTTVERDLKAYAELKASNCGVDLNQLKDSISQMFSGADVTMILNGKRLEHIVKVREFKTRTFRSQEELLAYLAMHNN